MADKGFVGIQSGVNVLVYDLTLSSLSQSTGGNNGAYSLYINGAGFPS